MKTIAVNTSTCYDVIVGSNLLKNIGTYLNTAVPNAKKVAIISDSNVFPLYGTGVKQSLEHSGYTVISYTFPYSKGYFIGITFYIK